MAVDNDSAGDLLQWNANQDLDCQEGTSSMRQPTDNSLQSELQPLNHEYWMFTLGDGDAEDSDSELVESDDYALAGGPGNAYDDVSMTPALPTTQPTYASPDILHRFSLPPKHCLQLRSLRHIPVGLCGLCSSWCYFFIPSTMFHFVLVHSSYSASLCFSFHLVIQCQSLLQQH
jgi:hypothetical protein